MSYKYTIDGKDYLTLWKYFEEEASNVKSAMFSTITWVMGFAAALVAFLFSTLADKFSDSTLSLAILTSIAGLALCGYAHYTIRESAKHIKNNWLYANRCKNSIGGLNDLVCHNTAKGKESWLIKRLKKHMYEVKICARLAIIVYFFAAVFLFVSIYSLVCSF